MTATNIPFNKPFVSESGNTYHFKVSHSRKQSSGVFPTLQHAWNYFGISDKYRPTERDFEDMLQSGEAVIFLEDPVVDEYNFIGISLRRAA